MQTEQAPDAFANGLMGIAPADRVRDNVGVVVVDVASARDVYTSLGAETAPRSALLTPLAQPAPPPAPPAVPPAEDATPSARRSIDRRPRRLERHCVTARKTLHVALNSGSALLLAREVHPDVITSATRAVLDGAPLSYAAVAPMSLSADQRLLLVALAERAVRRGTTGVRSLNRRSEAAGRLGWPLTSSHRKVDALCTKRTRSGVAGVHGDSFRAASSRGAKLVEQALCVRLVTLDDSKDLPSRSATATSGDSQ